LHSKFPTKGVFAKLNIYEIVNQFLFPQCKIPNVYTTI
jgi:hypothetical protein